MQVDRRSWMRVFVVAMLLVAVVASAGCTKNVERNGLWLKRWNESTHTFTAYVYFQDMEHYDNSFGLIPEDHPYEENEDEVHAAGGGYTCQDLAPDPMNPWDMKLAMRIVLEDVDTGEKQNFAWSDIGCGTWYVFIYHADGTATLRLIEKDYRITRDVPVPAGRIGST